MNDYIPRALAHAAAESASSPSSAATSWTASGEPQRTRSGLTVVHLQQRLGGIPVRGCVRSVRFDAVGMLTRFTGETAEVEPTVALRPAVRVRSAVYAACRHMADEVIAEQLPEVARRVSRRRPRILAEFAGPEAATALLKTPFEGPILASLMVLPDSSELVWDVRLRVPGPGATYSVLVAASGSEPRVLTVERRSSHAVSGMVFRFDPRTPRVRDAFPRGREDHPAFEGRRIPRTAWVMGTGLMGNNVVCIDDRGRGFSASAVGADLRFEAAEAEGMEQAKINAFYTCNYLHDFFLLLGFDESLGNFQKENAPGAGRGGDPLRVVVWDAEIPGAAFFKPEPDGAMAELNLGRIGARHTALDASVVIHEFTHGVTSRVIGGPDVGNPLTQPQSRALGEGFSDYFALTILNRERRRAGLADTAVYGEWVSSKATGLRNFAYDPSFTGSYGRLGTPSFKADHDAGQVWCAALLELHRVLVQAEGPDTGEERAWQLVFDSLRLLHPGSNGPTFLHGRDAVLDELDAAVVAGRLPGDPGLRQNAQDAFTRRGMGPAARSPKPGFRSIEEDKGPFGDDG